MTAFRPRFSSLFHALLILLPAAVCLRSVAQGAPTFPVTTFNASVQGTTFVSGNFGTGTGAIVYFDGTQIETVPALSDNTPVPTPLNSACTTITSLVTADFNGDHHPDIAFVCENSGTATIQVLLGDGVNGFPTQATYAVAGDNIASLAQPVSLKGAGVYDLVAFTNAGKVAVFTNNNNGTGTFASAILYGSPFTSGTIFSGDFNGDGHADIALVSSGSPSGINLLLGDGTGALAASSTVQAFPAAIFSSNFSVVSGDFNNDHITDLAYLATSPTSFATEPSTLQVLLGAATNPLTSGPSLALPELTLAPYPVNNLYALPNGSKTDIALTSYGTTILQDQPDGSFTIGPSFMLTGTIIPIPDASGTTASLAVKTILGAAPLNPFSSSPDPLTNVPAVPVSGAHITAIDLNGDALTDLISADPNTGQITVELGRGNQTFTSISQSTTLIGQAIAIADFNGDGSLDLAGLLDYQGQLAVCIFSGDGAGNFAQPAGNCATPAVSGLPTNAAAADFNKDGIADLVVDTFVNNQFTLTYIPVGANGSLGTPVTLATLSTDSPIFAVDLNHDGNIDILWNGAAFINTGTGTFSAPKSAGLTATPLTLGDVNGDNIPDAVVGSSVYLGIGDGTFAGSPAQTLTLPTGATPTAAAIGAFTSSGNPADLAIQYSVANSSISVNQGVALFYNNGTAFTADTNIYYDGAIVGPANSASAAFSLFSSCLNNSVCNQSSGQPRDLIAATGANIATGGQNPGLATLLFNAHNPAPSTAPAALGTKLSLAFTPNPAQIAQPVTFTGNIAFAHLSGNTPTGNVTVSTTSPAGNCPDASTLAANGNFTFGCTFTAAGTYTVTASYAGDTNNAPSQDSVQVVVGAGPSSVVLTPASSTIAQNGTVTFSAAVTGANPTGTVTFASSQSTLGTANLDSSGIATITASFATAGTYTVTATYGGDSNNTSSSSNSVTVTVQAGDFAVGLQPPSATIPDGQSATTTITITPLNNYSGTIRFACGGLAEGMTCSFSPASVTSTNGSQPTSTLTVTTLAPHQSTTLNTNPGAPIGGGIALGSLLLFVLNPRGARILRHRLARTGLFALLLLAGLFTLSGCGAAKYEIVYISTPVGQHNVTVYANDVVNNLTRTANFQVNVQ